MLSEIRDRATGWIAYIVVGIIVIPFAFWGVNEYFAGGEEIVVATVNGAEIQQVEYRRALDGRREQLRRVMGENFQADLANSPAFKRGVLDDMISRILLDQHAEDQGYHVGDELLAQTIQLNPRFQDNERFSSEAYRSAVAQMGLTQSGFEERLRRELVLQQIRDGIRESSFTTPRQRTQLLQLMLQERLFDYAVLKAESFVGASEVPDAAIQEEYESNSDLYRTAEQLKVEYVELSVDDLASTISVTDEEVRQAYEQNNDRFATDPVRRASHILIEAGPDADEAAREAALAEARDLLEQLRAGADFAELAREHSDDPGSASKDGDLGRIEPGVMVEPFEEALFALEEEGALTEPVRTRFGYHIIKLTGYQPGAVKPLEEVREQLEEEERTRQAESLFLDRAETFRNVSYEQPQSLEPVADHLDLEIRQSGWFTRDEGEGIAANPKVRDAAFGEDVYQDGLNSEAIEMDINTLVVVRRLDQRPASVKPLEEVRGEIEEQLKRRTAEERVASLGPELVEQLNAGDAWESIVEEHGLDDERVARSRGTDPGEQAPDPAVVDAVFRAPEPSGGEPVSGGVALSNGDYALFRLVEVKEGDPARAPEDLEKRVSDSLARRQTQDMEAQLIADLREQADVSIKEDAL